MGTPQPNLVPCGSPSPRVQHPQPKAGSMGSSGAAAGVLAACIPKPHPAGLTPAWARRHEPVALLIAKAGGVRGSHVPV